MTPKATIGLVALCLAGCAKPYAPIETSRPPLDLPDAALVAPCDTSEGDPATNGQLVEELNTTRRQRDDCAAQVDGIRQWRSDAIRRHEETPTTP